MSLFVFRFSYSDIWQIRLNFYIHVTTIQKNKSYFVFTYAQRQNHSTQDSRVVPHRGTNWAALWLTAQIGRDAVLSESYGRGYLVWQVKPQTPLSVRCLVWAGPQVNTAMLPKPKSTHSGRPSSGTASKRKRKKKKEE